ncbi:MAG: hypothetical protein EOO10_24125 [Chitinophagaceae bacterium]|nr:MAG: hypothetical protein EOO10_24125 [Chitinophagaceae bacterium]
MKKFQRLAFCLLVKGLLFSCSSDDDGGGTSASIEAKWTPIKTVFKASGVSQTVNYDQNEAGCDKDYIQFVTGGSLKDAVYYKNSAEVCTEDADSQGTWVRTGDNLVIANSNDYDGSYDIKKLNSTDLQIHGTEDLGGVNADVTVYFKKVN